MHILMVSAECAPVAKTGGLGDFVEGLARELAIRGNRVEIVLPRYDCMRQDKVWQLHKVYEDLWVPFYDQWLPCDVEFGFVEGLKCYFIAPRSQQGFFDRGRLYGEDDDADRFAFFCRAVLEFMHKTEQQPDMVHCHDWQTGLVPVLLYELYQGLGVSRPRVCYTLHNVGYQGITGDYILQQVGLDPASLMTPERLLDHTHPHAVNLMKGGIVYANYVTTVSPRYAWEIQNTEQGMGLQATLQRHAEKFGGVLNGIDYSVWNPEIDPHIAHNYSADSLPLKAKNKRALRERLMLREQFMPVIAVIGRLDRQKGADLIRRTIFFSLENDCQFVLLGAAAEPVVNDRFMELKHQLNDNPDCHLEIAYDEELAHWIYAGADMIVIPSIYEPCGLTQMIAMRYGMVPIVRRVGGLADTVFDANYSEQPFEQRNGYAFEDYTEAALESAMSRAIGLWSRFPEYFRQLRLNGMRQDHSWNQPGERYLEIYNHIRS